MLCSCGGQCKARKGLPNASLGFDESFDLVSAAVAIRVEIDDSEIVLRLSGVDLLTFRRVVRVPRECITDVGVARRGDLEPHIEHRISGLGSHYGTRFPNRRRVGPMMRRGVPGTEFWAVERGSDDQELVVCSLDGHRYARLVLGIDDDAVRRALLDRAR